MIVSNSTNAESTNANGLTAFITDGFTAGSDINVNGGISIAHGWKANGQGSANTDGTINTTYTSANTTSGFSIIKYTGSGSAGTVGHGLGATPDLTIRRKINATGDWFVHTTAIDGSLDFVKLNSTDSKSNSSLTGFTSSTIGVDADSSEEIIYVFKQITGFSKFGTYSTNNNQTNGPFIYLGFKPSFIIAKNISASGYNWVMWNNKLNPRNQSQFFHHHPNTNDTWVDNTNRIDMLSNGFKFYSYDTETNGGGDTILYMAWAEAPLVGSNNVPCTAR
tara:strand:- start:601 stop:1434 length:834 start_codon:yes stop_codon:yes gene_type:complete